jgi:hypothetical protein
VKKNWIFLYASADERGEKAFKQVGVLKKKKKVGVPISAAEKSDSPHKTHISLFTQNSNVHFRSNRKEK